VHFGRDRRHWQPFKADLPTVQTILQAIGRKGQRIPRFKSNPDGNPSLLHRKSKTASS